MDSQNKRKLPRVLCLHGFRRSGEIQRKLIQTRWPEKVVQKLDLVFLNGPYPAQGRSDVEGIFDPPYYEWFQANKDFSEFTHFEECVEYIQDFMVKNGPFDGVLGFSQGALLASAFPGMQNQGVALTKVPKIKFLVIISGEKLGGAKFGIPKLATNAFSSPITCPSLHFIGEMDFFKKGGTVLLESFLEPVVIHHLEGHNIPRLDENQELLVLDFVERIQKLVKEFPRALL